MIDKINGTKPVYSLITEFKISKEQLDKILEMCTPIVNIEPDYPLLFGTPMIIEFNEKYYNPDNI